MFMEKCNLIAIEGLDGVGKQTIVKKLCGLLKNMYGEKAVATVAFPRYECLSGKLIKRVLCGDIGDPSKLSPNFMSVFYEIDEYIYFEKYMNHENELDFGNLEYLVMDRSFYSNLMYQGAKINAFTYYPFANFLVERYANAIIRPGLRPFIDNIKIIVLRMNKQDRLLQINNRNELDCVESNLSYMDRVHIFSEKLLSKCYLNHDRFIETLKEVTDLYNRHYLCDITVDEILKVYFENVYSLNVLHYDDSNKEEIMNQNLLNLAKIILPSNDYFHIRGDNQ